MSTRKNITATPTLMLGAVITTCGYAIGFDQWLCNVFKWTNVPLGVVWAICQVIAWPIVWAWHRSLWRAWEAPYLALVLFVMPLTCISYRQGAGPSMNTRQYNRTLRDYACFTAAACLLFTLMVDAARIRRDSNRVRLNG
jgi:hypothetical protein